MSILHVFVKQDAKLIDVIVQKVMFYAIQWVHETVKINNDVFIHLIFLNFWPIINSLSKTINIVYQY